MKTIVENAIEFKDGSSWAIGTAVIVSVPSDAPRLAHLENIEGEIRKVRSLNLYKWFPSDFPHFTEEDIMSALIDDICPTLTGENVEPDGWDSEGFPSILLAAGLI